MQIFDVRGTVRLFRDSTLEDSKSPDSKWTDATMFADSMFADSTSPDLTWTERRHSLSTFTDFDFANLAFTVSLFAKCVALVLTICCELIRPLFFISVTPGAMVLDQLFQLWATHQQHFVTVTFSNERIRMNGADNKTELWITEQWTDPARQVQYLLQYCSDTSPMAPAYWLAYARNRTFNLLGTDWLTHSLITLIHSPPHLKIHLHTLTNTHPSETRRLWINPIWIPGYLVPKKKKTELFTEILLKFWSCLLP